MHPDSPDPQTQPPAHVRTLPELFAWRVAATPRGEAYRQFDATSSAWISTSWADAGERVQHWQRALARTIATTGMGAGARVAILLPNGLNGVCIDQAVLALGCVPVPLHAIDNPESIAYILGDSEASLLVAASRAQWQAIARLGVALPALRQVVITQAEAGETGEADAAAVDAGEPAVVSLNDWLAVPPGAAAPAAAPRAPLDGDLAALVYTSGTTGKPKGVMLTHANVMANVRAALTRVAPLPGDVLLSFLPMSHTFERTAGYYLPIAAGCCVAFARSVALLADDFRIVRPTMLISVPRIYERVHGKLIDALAESPLKARLFAMAEHVGWRRFCRQQKLPVEPGGHALTDSLAWRILEPLVARKLLAQFGGRLRVAISGGAPLSQPLAHCFLGLGLPVVQGYGMTETSPIATGNSPEDNDPATVGRALPGVELRIAENRELQVRGLNVMRGYWKRPDDTARAFTEDGWLRTGDQADITGGRVRILGRIKEIIVTSTGEKIPPGDLELAITSDPLFEQACVFGDNRPFIACALVLHGPEWERLAASLGLAADKPASLTDDKAREAVLQRIRQLTRNFPHYAQPRAVCLSLQAWTPDNALMTPTLKIKRQNLAAHFAVEIEAIYRR